MFSRLREMLLLTGVAGISALGILGCLQKEGEPCQTNSDCKKGLVCCFDSVTGKGTCQSSCIPVDSGLTDAAPQEAGIDAAVDAQPADAAVDATQEDAAPPDSTTIDAETVDAETVDAQTIDAETIDAAP